MMKLTKIRTGLRVLLLIALLGILPRTAFAAEKQAEQISWKECTISFKGIRQGDSIFDGNLYKGTRYPGKFGVTIECEKGFGSLYVIFDQEYPGYTITDNETGKSGTWGVKGILHEFVDLEGYFGTTPKSITLSFNNGAVQLNEICMFTSGETPEFVQKWDVPEDERADLVLFSTHADDEQLFFAGMLPYYAGELGYRVQVVYLTNHRNLNNLRCHEALNGLWKVGVTRYPMFGSFGDYYTMDRLKNAYDLFHYMHVSDEDLMRFMVEQIRRYKPIVAVGHDTEGEYGHAMHMLYADLLIKADKFSGNAEKYPESADRYGVWEIPKIYLHLYPENPIVMDWDQPLEHFGGRTAFEMTRDYGFPSHTSQVKDYKWYYVGADKATDVKKYSPCEFGLYKSRVGEDVKKNDFFENADSYDRQAELELEEARRKEEEERRKVEEEERLAAQKAAEEEAWDAQQQQQADQRDRNTSIANRLLVFFLAVGLGGLLAAAWYAAELERKRKAEDDSKK